MGAIKEYMMELSEKLGKEFEDISEYDMITDLKRKAQVVYFNDTSTEEELEKVKHFLPIKSYSEVKFYDAETGSPKFKVGDVLMSNGIFFLIK